MPPALRRERKLKQKAKRKALGKSGALAPGKEDPTLLDKVKDKLSDLNERRKAKKAARKKKRGERKDARKDKRADKKKNRKDKKNNRKDKKNNRKDKRKNKKKNRKR